MKLTIERAALLKVLGRWNPAASSATAYALFLWRQDWTPGMPPVVRPFAPGTRRRLTKVDDAARFGGRQPAPMLDAMESAA